MVDVTIDTTINDSRRVRAVVDWSWVVIVTCVVEIIFIGCRRTSVAAAGRCY
jgi:hypothetical protein